MNVAAPTRPQIQTWRTGHLTESAAYLAITAETWEHAFSNAYNHTLAPGGSVETDEAVANSLTTIAGLGPLPEPPAAGPPEATAVQLLGHRWGATIELPPAPAGKEWHYYWNWGWVLEDPLEDCSTGDKFWDTALIVTGGLGAIFTGPVGFIAGLAVAGEASHELGQCK